MVFRLCQLSPLALEISFTIKSHPWTSHAICQRSASQSGAISTCHIEDLYLQSIINYLHAGPKSWIVIAPKYASMLEQRNGSTGLLKPSQCAQCIRHASLYIRTTTLTAWNIPYTWIDQRQGEIVITDPNADHQGLGVCPTRAEAVNYAGKYWSIDDYPLCIDQCLKQLITQEPLQFKRSNGKREKQGALEGEGNEEGQQNTKT